MDRVAAVLRLCGLPHTLARDLVVKYSHLQFLFLVALNLPNAHPPGITPEN